MSRNYKFGNDYNAHFVTFTVIDWIDLFIRNEYKDILIESWKYCQKEKGLQIYGWVIMTSHVHMIVRSSEGSISKIIGEMKSFTSRKLRSALEKHSGESRKDWMLNMFYGTGKHNCNTVDWQLWQQHSHPIELDTQELFDQKLDYIHFNPVVAGFVDAPEHFVYSSAGDFAGRDGLIELEFDS